MRVTMNPKTFFNPPVSQNQNITIFANAIQQKNPNEIQENSPQIKR